MADLKPNARDWTIKEQRIEDAVTGLTFQFEVSPGGWMKLILYGNSLRFGNRELIFNSKGIFDGGGTSTGRCKPAWLIETGDGDD